MLRELHSIDLELAGKEVFSILHANIVREASLHKALEDELIYYELIGKIEKRVYNAALNGHLFIGIDIQTKFKNRFIKDLVDADFNVVEVDCPLTRMSPDNKFCRLRVSW